MKLKNIRFAAFCGLAATGGLVHSGLAVETIQLGTQHGELKFDKEVIHVAPGSEVRLEFSNNDEIPHNVLICKPGTSTREIGEQALLLGDTGMEKNFIPNSNKILFSTPLVEPAEMYVLSFTAPKSEGDYPYVCTFPGHYLLMFGTLVVSSNPNKAPQAPKPDKQLAIEVGDTPYIYRSGINVPGVGKIPFGIGVGLPGGFNYCFDAADCAVKGAWFGRFLDVSKDWNGRGGNGSQPIGPMFYRNKKFPLSFAQANDAPVDFKGYRLKDGSPRFLYEIGGIKIEQNVLVNPAQTGIIQSFHIIGANGPITFSNPDHKNFSSPQGALKDGKLVVPSSGARTLFEVEIKP